LIRPINLLLLVAEYYLSVGKHLKELFTKTMIVVFHDSLKAKKNLYYTLPKVPEHFTKEGYTFECL